jgi:Kef-type K+ transport system membrane component KefB
MAVTIALLFALSICTHLMGVFAIFGGFAAGLLFHREHAFVEAWRHQVGQFVLVFFLPVFFTYTGLRTNVLGLTTSSEWAWFSLILTVAVLSKIVPVYAAARFAGFGHAESSVMGALMNTRALMEGGNDHDNDGSVVAHPPAADWPHDPVSSGSVGLASRSGG